MSQMTAALFESRDDARRAVHALRDHGVDKNEISVLADGANGATIEDFYADRDGVPEGDATGKDQGISTTTAGDAGKGAAEGAAIGAGLGIAAAIASLVIPGFGLVVAGGALATALTGAAATAAGGAVAGGVAGYLADMGVPDKAAHHYTEGVRKGGVFVSVHDTTRATPEEIHQILVKYNGQESGTYSGAASAPPILT